jgi:YfiR/HmsC-like
VRPRAAQSVLGGGDCHAPGPDCPTPGSGISGQSRVHLQPAAFRSPDAPLNLCIATPNPFGDALRQTFQSERVGSHPVAIVPITSPGAVIDCHVLFIGSDADATGALEQVAQNAPVLTIGESPRFEQRGGMITFVIEQGRVRFDLNQTAAARVNLQFSSKVLQVARNIS